MALNPVDQVKGGGSGGGGLFGGLLGAIAGTVLGGGIPLSPGSLVGMSSGMQAGGQVGGLVDPGQAGGVSSAVPTMQNSKSNALQAVAQHSPEVQLATMQNSKNLLANSAMPGAEQYIGQINQAQDLLKERLKGAGSGGSMNA
jgi:hypothetical protein